MKKRRFYNGEVNHIYQRTLSGFNIFYEIEDYLVYYTIFSMMALKYKVIVYGLCLMIDHIHSLCAFESKPSFAKFMSHITNIFVREYNQAHNRVGPLFSGRFGSAPKSGLKLLRTSVAYLNNNPVERHLCKYAQEYRWNFLAYCRSACPFSDLLVVRNASFALKRAIAEVDGSRARGVYITYAMIRRLLSSLDNREKNQLVDYIIKTYSVIRYDLLTTVCYDGYENMLTAINSNAGSEYDITEYRCGRSDNEYLDLYRFAESRGYYPASSVISLDIDSKMSLYNSMLRNTRARTYQISKFLHLTMPPHDK